MNSKGQIQITSTGEALQVSGLRELGAANANSFKEQITVALKDQHKTIEIDLSETNYVDSCGLGALISIHKAICAKNGMVKLLNPTAPVQQILELTRMHRIFEVIKA